MNGALPGLLDDPQLSLTDLPTLTDFHIAPLRDPAPLKGVNIPSPLEPVTKSAITKRTKNSSGQVQKDEGARERKPPVISPSDVLSARETKKPVIAISELLDDSAGNHIPTQLPSFVSLAVVEKSPIQRPFHLEIDHPQKRLRLDIESENAAYDLNRLLPRPAQKDDKQPRPVPLLPAMVTGLHEPPPSAALLPSMDLDTRPDSTRTTTKTKMQVKDILDGPKQSSHGRPPELMINTPEISSAELPKLTDDAGAEALEDATSHSHPLDSLDHLEFLKKDVKARRMRRKWSDQETSDLLTGVRKHGFGKWKQILDDSDFSFKGRTSIDLKDRFRIFAKDFPELQTKQAKPENPELSPRNEISGDSRAVAIESLNDKPMSAIEISSKPRRKRHPWTKEEDEALLRGVKTHGFQWTDIHNDPDLHLNHRRATDLRDRIRNLYPEGYKQAEARPLRSELKKAGKASTAQQGVTEEHYESSGMKDITSQNLTTPERKISRLDNSSSKSHSKKAPSIAALTSTDDQPDSPQSKRAKASVTEATILEHGVTLPPLDLEEGHQLDWGDNTLAPFLRWDDNLGL